MKKVLYRIIAFGLDTILVSIIVALLAYIPFITPREKEINKNTKRALAIRSEYQEFISTFDSSLEDNIISEEEYKSFPDSYRKYINVTFDQEITKKEQEKMKKDISKYATETYNNLSYSISKMSVRQNYLSVIISVIYFGIIQYVFKGKTLFKKIFRLRVVNNKNEKDGVPLWKYLIRALLVSEAIFILLDAIFISTMTKGMYISSSSTMYTAKMIYEMIFLLFMAIRIDGRSIHDLILNTRVAFYDKKGEEIKDVIYKDNFKEEKEIKNVSPKKNKTTKKKKKEVIEAEKVND